jgi:predicted HicB family RNase H-like nuclease
VKHRRQPLIGVRNSPLLPIISKQARYKALFVSRFSPEVSTDDVEKSLNEQLSLNMLVCTGLKTKLNTSFGY